MKVYVDDMIIKRKTNLEHANNLREMFTILWEFGMKLNPKKCIYRVRGGKFLGLVINYRGIEANARIRGVLDM